MYVHLIKTMSYSLVSSNANILFFPFVHFQYQQTVEANCTLWAVSGYIYTGQASMAMDMDIHGYIHGYPRKICGYGYGYGWEISYPRQPCSTATLCQEFATKKKKQHIIQRSNSVTESCGKKHWRTYRSVNKYSTVELFDRGRNGDGFHLSEAAKWMTFRQQFGYWSIMKSSGQQQNNIINHVAVTAAHSSQQVK